MRNALLFLTLLAVIGISAPRAGTADPAEPVRYDPATHRLSIHVKQMALSKELTDIGAASGIRILMDPEADRSISTTLRDQPLESSLKQLVRGLNYVFHTIEGQASDTPLLVAMKVLASGSKDETRPGLLLPLNPALLSPPIGEARDWATAAGSSADESAPPWQVRMAQLNEANRKRLADHMRRLRDLRENPWMPVGDMDPHR